jgi:hypothetical protein
VITKLAPMPIVEHTARRRPMYLSSIIVVCGRSCAKV